MKAEISEYDTNFTIDLTPETMEDQAKLIRIGLNATKILFCAACYPYKDSKIFGFISIGKKKNATSRIGTK